MRLQWLRTSVNRYRAYGDERTYRVERVEPNVWRAYRDDEALGDADSRHGAQEMAQDDEMEPS